MFISILKDPFFTGGLVIRSLLLVFVVPWVQTEWFVPFIQEWISAPSIDPWSSYMVAGGDTLAFPYGPVMFITYLPFVLLGTILDSLFSFDGFARLGFGLTNLFFDFLLLVVLIRISKSKSRITILLYWLSPIVLYICYWYGQTDIIPVCLLILALFYLKQANPKVSGLFLGLAVSSKLSMILALPFFTIYLWNNTKLRLFLGQFFLFLMMSLVFLQLPFVFTDGFRIMIIENREMGKLYSLSLMLAESLQIYIVPVVYAGILYSIWRLGRMNFELLMASIGVGFFTILILTPSSVGWYLWIMPFLVFHQINSNLRSITLVAIFTFFFLGLAPVMSLGVTLPVLNLDLTGLSGRINELIPNRILSLWQTGLWAFGTILTWRLIREGIGGNDFFRFTRKPLVIGIAGDSGSGKDTLSKSLIQLFGSDSVTHISGDDYHLWDRDAPIWQHMTHLNPRANDLLSLHGDISSLIKGKPTQRPTYDHTTGRFTSPRKLQERDIIIVSGLHALSSKILYHQYDVSIFLDMEDDLRSYFKLVRDVNERSHSRKSVMETMEKRRPDSEKFIKPQASNADLIFRLYSVNRDDLNANDHKNISTISLGLHVTLRKNLYYDEIVRLLIGLCGLMVDVGVPESDGSVEIQIEGGVHADDIALVAGKLIPKLEDLMSLCPKWEGGMKGVIQVFVVVQSYLALTERT